MEKFDIVLNFKGKVYSGRLEAVMGAGDTSVYHLYIDKFYYGRLRRSNSKWVFDTNAGSKGWEGLADYFGERVSEED